MLLSMTLLATAFNLWYAWRWQHRFTLTPVERWGTMALPVVCGLAIYVLGLTWGLA